MKGSLLDRILEGLIHGRTSTYKLKRGLCLAIQRPQKNDSPETASYRLTLSRIIPHPLPPRTDPYPSQKELDTITASIKRVVGDAHITQGQRTEKLGRASDKRYACITLSWPVMSAIQEKLL